MQISIADDGPGITQEELVKVLEPFYRLDLSRNRISGGVGLGLASASDIVQRHGGKLERTNSANGGLVALVTLPRENTHH